MALCIPGMDLFLVLAVPQSQITLVQVLPVGTGMLAPVSVPLKLERIVLKSRVTITPPIFPSFLLFMVFLTTKAQILSVAALAPQRGIQILIDGKSRIPSVNAGARLALKLTLMELS